LLLLLLLLLLNGLHIGLRRLNDKMRLPLTKKVSTVAGDSVMQFFSEMVLVVLGEAWEYTEINIGKISSCNNISLAFHILTKIMH